MPLLELTQVSLRYQDGAETIYALENIDISVNTGEFVSVVGPSGSGKTSLFNVASGLQQPTTGQVELAGARLDTMTDRQRALFRSRSIGFVFQRFSLLGHLTVLENVELASEIANSGGPGRRYSLELLGRVGLSKRLQHFPSQLSGGEKQRTAIARALVNRPRCVFADEPTGNLDEKTARKVVDLMVTTIKEVGGSLLMITHDKELASRMNRQLSLREGKLVNDLEQ